MELLRLIEVGIDCAGGGVEETVIVIVDHAFEGLEIEVEIEHQIGCHADGTHGNGLHVRAVKVEVAFTASLRVRLSWYDGETRPQVEPDLRLVSRVCFGEEGLQLLEVFVEELLKPGISSKFTLKGFLDTSLGFG